VLRTIKVLDPKRPERCADPGDEAGRLAALEALDPLDSTPEAEFDALVEVAARVFGVPISLLTLVDGNRQWKKANFGLHCESETLRDVSFSAWAILAGDIFEVPDAQLDARFANNPLVTGQPGIRFYAGVTLRLSNGTAVGTLCVIDREARRLSGEQREILRCLGRAATGALEKRVAARGAQLAARALQDSEERLRRLYESTPAMLYSIDRTGRITAVSDFWLAKMGYRRAEVLGRKSLEFYTPESVAHARAVVQPAFFADGRCTDIAHQCVKKNGEVIDVLLSAVLERDADGVPLRSLTIVEDVTLRRRAEDALSEQSRRLNAIIEATRVGTWQWNLQTGEVIVNERWATNLGYELAELEPTSTATWAALAHPDDQARANALVRAHAAGETDVHVAELRMRHKDGRWVWIRDRGRVMTRTPDGRAEWMFGTQEDVTQRRLQDEALRESEDFLDRTGPARGCRRVGLRSCDRRFQLLG
jgi:PAS domain S-box-containing protein